MKITIRLFIIAGFLLFGFARPASAATMQMNSELLPTYVKIADALASDDLAIAKAEAATLSDRAGTADQSQIAKQATAVAEAEDLAVARDAFKVLSIAIEPLAAGEKGYVVMTCTMAKADWVQMATKVRNPYLGKAMLSCGAPKKVNAQPAPGHDHGDHGCDM